jgi:hypothetical protein
MAKKEEQVVEVEVAEEAEPNPVLSLAHKVLLAGIGVVALTQEEIEKFVAKLVERGEIAEQDGKKLVSDGGQEGRRGAGPAARGAPGPHECAVQG